jgi:glutamine---fructose-6-phosphate transaminase (isomerizing)
LSTPITPSPAFSTFMMKEVYEQPEAVQATLQQHLSSSTGRLALDRCSFSTDEFSNLRRITIVASGASRHAGLAGKLMIEDLGCLPVEVEHASEYCYRRPLRQEGSLVVVITQSGETGDTIAAQRVARENGFRTLAISNVVDSTIAREADATLFTYAGKEIAIPATKSFTAQLTALYVLALYLAQVRQTLRAEVIQSRIADLAKLPEFITRMLPGADSRAAEIARSYFSDQTFIFLGRGAHYPIALEGALKLKEIAYRYAEAYPSGELRHGPTALLDDSQAVVAIATRDLQDEGSVLRYQKTITLLGEIAKHSTRQVLVASEDDNEVRKIYSDCFFVPAVSELLLPIVEIIPLQLFAYHIAVLNNYNVDKPRNLMKSVRAD